MAALNNGIAAFYLAQRTLHQLVRHGVRKENHQIWPAKLILQATRRFCQHLGLTAVGLAQLLIAALHAFISAQNDNAHIFSFRTVVVLFYKELFCLIG